MELLPLKPMLRRIFFCWIYYRSHDWTEGGTWDMCWRCDKLRVGQRESRDCRRPAVLPDDVGSFDEMVTLASERAAANGGMAVVHREGCEHPYEPTCICQPKILQPYESIDEAEVAPN